MNEYTWLPCPFCGGKQISVTDKRDYYANLGQHGAACIRVTHINRARGCNIDVWELSDSVRGYNEKLRLLNYKWNRRAKVAAPEAEPEEGGVQSCS